MKCGVLAYTHVRARGVSRSRKAIVSSELSPHLQAIAQQQTAHMLVNNYYSAARKIYQDAANTYKYGGARVYNPPNLVLTAPPRICESYCVRMWWRVEAQSPPWPPIQLAYVGDSSLSFQPAPKLTHCSLCVPPHNTTGLRTPA